MLGMSALEEGVVVVGEEGTLQERRKKLTRGNNEPEKRRRCKHSPQKKIKVIYC
jgi:hypothetical protein